MAKPHLLIACVAGILLLWGCSKSPTSDGTDIPATSSVDTTLVAWFPFNGNANDESGNGRDGALTGATACADRFGKAAGAFNFSGNGDQIVVDTLDLSPPVTVSVWFRSTVQNSGFNSVFSWIEHGNRYRGLQILAYNWGHMFVRAGADGNDHQAPGVIDGDSLWHHMVLQKDSGNYIRAYLDNLLFLLEQDTSSTGTRHQLLIGQDCNSHFWKGQIDDIRVYRRVLPASEVSRIFNATN